MFSCSVSVMFYLCCSRCPLHAFDACFMLAAFFMISLCFISVLQSRVFQKKKFSGHFFLLVLACAFFSMR